MKSLTVKEVVICLLLFLVLIHGQKSISKEFDDSAYWDWQSYNSINELRKADTQRERDNAVKDLQYNAFMKLGSDLNEEMEDDDSE